MEQRSISTTLEDNIIQYIDYKVDAKINDKLEQINNTFADLHKETDTLRSKIVTLAKSLHKR